MVALEQQLIFAGVALLCASTSSVLDIQECKVADCVTAPAIAGAVTQSATLHSWMSRTELVLAHSSATPANMSCCSRATIGDTSSLSISRRRYGRQRAHAY